MKIQVLSGLGIYLSISLSALKIFLKRLQAEEHQKSTNDEYWDDGDIIWLTPTDFQGYKDSKYIDNSRRKITSKGLSACSAEILPINTVVMSTELLLVFKVDFG